MGGKMVMNDSLKTYPTSFLLFAGKSKHSYYKLLEIEE